MGLRMRPRYEHSSDSIYHYVIDNKVIYGCIYHFKVVTYPKIGVRKNESNDYGNGWISGLAFKHVFEQ